MSNAKSILIKQIQQLCGVEGVELVMVEPCDDNHMVCHVYLDHKSVVDRLTPDEVALRNYNSAVRCGKINDRTSIVDFTSKIKEEVDELEESIDYPKIGEHGVLFDNSELADISIVCDSIAIHYGIDLQAEKEKKMRYNESRTD